MKTHEPKIKKGLLGCSWLFSKNRWRTLWWTLGKEWTWKL